MGTENVADCIGMIVRDPVSGKTALAHIDRYSTPESLSTIFEQMPKGRQLDVVLWGAKFGGQADADPQMREWSEHNLHKALALLVHENVDVIAAEIYSQDIPSVVTVNPATFVIRGENPERQDNARTIAFHANPDHDLSSAKMILSYSAGHDSYLDRIALETAFDLTKAPGRSPLLLRREDVAILNEHAAGKNPEQVSEWAQTHYSAAMAPYVASLLPVWRKAYEKAFAPVADCAMRTMDSLEAKGTNFLHDDRDRVIQALRKLPLYTGENARECNEKLTDFIRSSLFKTGPDGHVDIDFHGLGTERSAEVALSARQLAQRPAQTANR
jgi:hypothetical protein